MSLREQQTSTGSPRAKVGFHLLPFWRRTFLGEVVAERAPAIWSMACRLRLRRLLALGGAGSRSAWVTRSGASARARPKQSHGSGSRMGQQARQLSMISQQHRTPARRAAGRELPEQVLTGCKQQGESPHRQRAALRTTARDAAAASGSRPPWPSTR